MKKFLEYGGIAASSAVRSRSLAASPQRLLRSRTDLNEQTWGHGPPPLGGAGVPFCGAAENYGRRMWEASEDTRRLRRQALS
jgi:hypothetical protein